MPTLSLTVLDTLFAVCKLPPSEPLPAWAQTGPLHSVTRTEDELSILCPQQNIPDDAHTRTNLTVEPGFRCLRINGTLEFTMLGVIAALAVPLAAARVSIFALSTYNTDYLFVHEHNLPIAVKTLRQHGHTILP